MPTKDLSRLLDHFSLTSLYRLIEVQEGCFQQDRHPEEEWRLSFRKPHGLVIVAATRQTLLVSGNDQQEVDEVANSILQARAEAYVRAKPAVDELIELLSAWLDRYRNASNRNLAELRQPWPYYSEYEQSLEEIIDACNTFIDNTIAGEEMVFSVLHVRSPADAGFLTAILYAYQIGRRHADPGELENDSHDDDIEPW